MFRQSAGEALAAPNWTAPQMGEIVIGASAQNCHSQTGAVSGVGGAAAVVPAVPPSKQHIARLTLN